MEEITRELDEKVNLSCNLEAGKTKDLGEGVIEVIVSNGSEDRHGEMIDPKGIDTKNYNGVVLYGHDYDALPIGKAIKVWKDRVNGQLKAKMQFAIDEYPFAKTVYDLVKGGYLNDVSIGGIVKKWSEDFKTIEKMEMIEFSVVNIGANRDAKIISRSIGKSTEEIKEEYQEAVSKHYSDRIAKGDKDEIKDGIKSLKNLIALLEGTQEELSEIEADEQDSEMRTKLITMKSQVKQVDHQAESVIRSIKIKLKKE